MSAVTDAAMAATRPVVSVRNVSKVFGSTRALDGVSLEIRRGEVHALCGGNGCGKSTLIKILSGVVPGDRGTIHVGERDLSLDQVSSKMMHGLGIRVVHQDLAVFPDLSVAENISFGDSIPTTSMGNVRWSAINESASRAIQQFGIPARPNDVVSTLPVATRAQIAIGRALRDVQPGSGLLILDEATASLPVREVGLLHNAIRRLAAAGHAVLFVSHRLDEVLALSDRVTVLRDGRVTATHDTASLTESELIESILGSRVRDVQRSVAVEAAGEPLLTVTELSAGPLRDVNLKIYPGEVVGIAGLLGSGRTELLRALCGDLQVSSGTIVLNGKSGVFRSLSAAIKRGVAFIPEDRVNGAIFPDMSVAENMDISVLSKYWRLSGFRRNQLRRDADELHTRFRIKSPTVDVPMSALSGGNQQKAVLARWLRRNPQLLLLDEPTQGVDVGARADIYGAVREVSDAGGAAIVVTSDLEELAQVVDRAVVLVNGRIAGHISHDDLSAHLLSEAIYKEGSNHE
ncbi:sugar ABC transporter ATP-binding protein [Rhodococcus opacus]|uniref:sugar ABC transporter ATP-binding protein n=1 Tax=Rhodococcus opacus TaxID=37919 RepID=UPI001C4468E6|nr:sugar ABC transporter ATP-binding protein [Rhodococcus opacus]MBV6756649.1 sugar ABC transporter ATP-binding protein [Rhodococcus opacus]